jgi:predicted HTH domain antitoxin
MTEEELRRELAVLLFQKERLTLGQASRLADMDRLRFQHLLASRGIPMHYDVEEFEQDLATLRLTEYDAVRESVEDERPQRAIRKVALRNAERRVDEDP